MLGPVCRYFRISFVFLYFVVVIFLLCCFFFVMFSFSFGDISGVCAFSFVMFVEFSGVLTGSPRSCRVFVRVLVLFQWFVFFRFVFFCFLCP